MTQKDYVALALALASVRERPEFSNSSKAWWAWREKRKVWVACVDAVAKVLASDNSRFDKTKFLDMSLK